jgi:hypothetical protein
MKLYMFFVGIVFNLKIVSGGGYSFPYFIYYFLWLCSPAQAKASSFTRFRGHTQCTTVGRTPLDE